MSKTGCLPNHHWWVQKQPTIFYDEPIYCKFCGEIKKPDMSAGPGAIYKEFGPLNWC